MLVVGLMLTSETMREALLDSVSRLRTSGVRKPQAAAT